MIPPSIYIAFAIAALSLLGGIGIGMKWSEHKLLRLQANYAEALTAQAMDARQREAQARAEERRFNLRIRETADAANLQADAARRSAGAVSAERDRLRDAYLNAFTASRTGPDSAAAPGSAPAAGAGLVLAGLFDRGADLIQSCAAALDQSRIAGLACERSYDSLTLISTKD